jgi:hypothetical protein
MTRLLGSLRGGRLVIAGLVALGLVVALARVGVTVYTEILWQVEAGYGRVYATRILWQWGARVAGGVLVGVLVFADLKIVSRTLAGIQIKRRFGNLEISEQLPASYVSWVMLGAAVLLGAWFGAAVPPSLGLQTLMLVHGEPWGLAEPFLGRDVGWYVFWVPVLGSAITFVLVVVFLLFTLATAGYTTTGALRWSRGRLVAQRPARVHLGVLLGLFFMALGARLWLARYLILMDGSSGVQGIFGFTDAQARLPGLQTLLVICVVAGVTIAWAAWRNRGAVLLGTAVAAVLVSLVIGQIYPAVVQRFQVEPNELERETRYIEENLAFTRAGFGLDGLRRERFGYEGAGPVAWADAAAQFAGLPVWNTHALLTTYRQLEARFPYYDFADVTLHRYPFAAGDEVVALSVREVDPAGIQDPNWQNLHLRERYVAGMGVVASRAVERTPEGRPSMLLTGIPPVAGQGALRTGLTLDRPQIFYGTRPQPHAVVNPGPEQFLAPDGSPGRPGTDFPEGIRLSSWLRTAALAWRFRDANLLFSGEVTAESRFVYRRQVLERAQAVAPFLRYPEAPFPVVADGRVVWVLEGFTGSRAFPLSSAHELQPMRPVTWTRNSVKVTVDAVTGRVDFYRMPLPDPLADVYEKAFPGLLRPLADMPDGIRRHLRYSRQLFALQAQVLLQYHQETARAFHGQQDVWALPTELGEGTSPVPYAPEYGLWALPGDEAPRFNLATVFVPAGRQNLTGLLVGRTGAGGLPELVLLDVPVEDQAPGPRQVEALVEQDPQISQQLSLWRSGGSEVWTGHLHVVPVGRRFVYMEPVFLAAAADAIPELRRFVVSDGVRVAMAEDLPGAVAALAGWDAGSPGAVPGPPGSGAAGLPRAALELLNRAEERLRNGDWAGFGEALRELRALLERRGPGEALPGR